MGKMDRLRKDLTGERYGRWTALKISHTKDGSTYWLCRCDCGKERPVKTSSLTGGCSKSCGCLHREVATTANTKHGMSRTKLYSAWLQMHRRCDSSYVPEYKNYGKRGIIVCERWGDFQNFYDDMGEMPPGLSLDRIDVNGNYEPSNCRWATWDEQGCNRRTNKFYAFAGETHILSQWAKITGIKRGTLFGRIVVRNWTVEKALTTPV